MNPRRDSLISLILFLGSFALYLFSCGGSVAPYRDSGEMITLLNTLGIAHPPGYPFYAVAGRLVYFIPFGNPAYAANVFSAVAAAGALVLVYRIGRIWRSPAPALITAMVFGVTARFWELASVSEMYTFGFFWLCLVIYTFFIFENAVLTAFPHNGRGPARP